MTKFDSWDSYFADNPRDSKIAEDQRVLRNLLGATGPSTLAEQERAITMRRVFELERNPIAGAFDFDHHRAIHRHIFKEVYEWAGEPRTVDMGKTHRLWPSATLVQGAPGIYGAIAKDNYLREMEPDQFTGRLAEHWGEVNVLHAFREGNTRSQRAFFSQLADQAGYVLDGPYLEAHYRDFNIAREAAMVTGRSDTFAAFLQGAVHRKSDGGPAGGRSSGPAPKNDPDLAKAKSLLAAGQGFSNPLDPRSTRTPTSTFRPPPAPSRGTGLTR